MVADRVIESLKLGVGPMDIGTATAQYNKAGIAKEMVWRIELCSMAVLPANP